MPLEDDSTSAKDSNLIDMNVSAPKDKEEDVPVPIPIYGKSRIKQEKKPNAFDFIPQTSSLVPASTFD